MIKEMQPIIRQSLENIRFLDRYKKIVEDNSDFNKRYPVFDIDRILQIFQSLGYTATYNKKENFFKITESKPPYDFQLNIMLGDGVMDIVPDVKQNGERLSFGGGGWSPIASRLTTGDRLKRIVFTSYENMEEILKEIFAIHEDFKNELFKQMT